LETIRFSTPEDQTIPGTLQNLEMFASFQNVLFTFDNSSDNDLAVYEYELYEEDDIVDPNTPELYILKPNPLIAGQYVPPFKSGAGNSSVFAVPVEGSYIDVENNNIVVQKNFFGRVRARDTSGNPGQWTDIKKTDQSTPLIDSQYIVSLTASKIKAGEIESAAITLGGANPLETIIQSKTYVTSSGQEGWYIDGAGEFSLGGPQGINYNGSSITIGSDVQVTANLAADSISVGSGLNQLNINDSIGPIVPGSDPPRNVGGMSLGQGLNNYWYGNGNFRVGNSTNYVIWNGSSLQIKGEVTADSGTIGGWNIQPSFIRSSNNSVTLNSNGLLEIGTSPTNKASITADGDFTVIGNGGGSYGIGTASFFGPWYVVKKGSDPSANQPFVQLTYKDFTFFTNTSGEYKIFIGGGNDNNNAFIDVGATGITDNNSISCSGWFRSSGQSGWYSQTYGGGIWMIDTSTVRVYGDKNFYTGGTFVSPTAFFDSGSSNIGANVAIKRAFSASDKRFMVFLNAASDPAGSIEYDGSSTKVKYNVTSDLRIKTNVRKMNSALLKVNKFNPVTFNYIDTDSEHDGFLAQELYEVYKNPITKPDKEEDYWMMDYSSLTPILTAAIQELSKKVEYLENKIKNM
jgi:hypothetical protein